MPCHAMHCSLTFEGNIEVCCNHESFRPLSCDHTKILNHPYYILPDTSRHCHAEYEYVANWTVIPGSRTNATNKDPIKIVASMAATCTDGTKLQAVATPRLKAGYITAYGTAVDITSDMQAPPLSDDLNGDGGDGKGEEL